MRNKLIYYNWGPLPYILLGFFTVFTIIPMVLLIQSITSGDVESFGFIVLTGPLIFLIMGVIGLIFSFILISVKIRQKKIDNFSTDEEEEVRVFLSEINETKEIQSKEAIDWNKIHPLIIKQRTVDQKCPVCKLPIEKEDFVVQCPHCSRLFHGKHLIEWLLKNNRCPVCQETIEIR